MPKAALPVIAAEDLGREKKCPERAPMMTAGRTSLHDEPKQVQQSEM
jgi:hypothetical protein